MNAITPILDSVAVLAAAAGKGCDKDGIIKLADKTWLDNSIFNKVRVRHSCDYNDFFIREGFGFYDDFDEAGRRVMCWEDPDKVFYFSSDPTGQKWKNKPASFWSDPLNGCGVTVKTSWLNLYYLIDMAATELAKEINKIPTHDQAGKHYSKKERLYRFHDVIEERIQVFILDELPSIMVELLGHPLTEVIRLMQKELQTIYQLIFLLADNKAEIGNGCFMWHLNQMRQGMNYLYIPHFDAVGGTAGVVLNFPLSDCFTLGSGDDWVDWLGNDNIIDQESVESSDYYLFRNISELMAANKLLPLRVDCRWQYLSIDTKHRLNVKNIMQEALTYGLKSIAEESFINNTFAKEVCRKGVASVNWDGIFYPDFSSLKRFYE